MTRQLPMFQTLDSYERPDICGPCGGKCCQNAPGIASPEEFGAPDEAVMRQEIGDRLCTGRWALDWWEGDPRPEPERARDEDGNTESPSPPAYYLRPAVRGHEGALYHPSWGGVCTFHGPTGCEIFPDRPDGCRGLEPHAEGTRCLPRRNDKRAAAVAWWPYRALLEEMAQIVGVNRGRRS